MYSTSIKALNHWKSAYAFFAQHEDAKGVLALLLFVMVILVTTLILHLRIDQNEHTEQVQGNNFMPKPGEVAIDIPNLVSLPAPPPMKSNHPSNNLQDAVSLNPTIDASSQVKEIADLPCKQPKNEMIDPVAPILVKTPHLHTSTSMVGTSQSLTDETVNNGNAAVRDQSVLDMSDDTDSLLHQASTPAEETSNCNFDIENPLNLSPEGEQTSYGVSIQSTAQAAPPIPIPGIGTLTPPPVPGPEAEEPDLKFELKVATWVTIISAGGIVSVISGVIGNEKALLPRKLLFKGFTSLNYIALVSSIGLYILIKVSPNISGFVRIVKFIMWIAIGSLVYSLGLATCIMFPAKIEVVLILVVPLVLVGLVGILSFACRE